MLKGKSLIWTHVGQLRPIILRNSSSKNVDNNGFGLEVTNLSQWSNIWVIFHPCTLVVDLAPWVYPFH